MNPPRYKRGDLVTCEDGTGPIGAFEVWRPLAPLPDNKDPFFPPGNPQQLAESYDDGTYIRIGIFGTSKHHRIAYYDLDKIKPFKKNSRTITPEGL